MIENIVDDREDRYRNDDLLFFIEPYGAENPAANDAPYQWTDIESTLFEGRAGMTIKEAIEWGNSFTVPVTLTIHDSGRPLKESGFSQIPELSSEDELAIRTLIRSQSNLDNQISTATEDSSAILKPRQIIGKEVYNAISDYLENHELPEKYIYLICLCENDKNPSNTKNLIERLLGIEQILISLYNIDLSTLKVSDVLTDQILKRTSKLKPFIAVSLEQVEYLRSLIKDETIEFIVRCEINIIRDVELIFETSRDSDNILMSILSRMNSIPLSDNASSENQNDTSLALTSLINEIQTMRKNLLWRDLLLQKRNFLKNKMKIIYQMDLKKGNFIDFEKYQIDEDT
ncbi:MAG: hypothetical protein WCK42_07580 [Myxococcaceae bacterium]